MSLIPTIYASSDAGAPVLTGQAGTLIALLRAILVTGYGTAPNAKAGLGWTEEFSATNKAVFRNNPVSGSGYRLRVLDDATAAAGGSGRSATLRGYSNMTDIDTGADPTPTVAQFANGTLWMKSSLADATARAWWAIGNERALYLFVDVYGAADRLCPFLVGDLLSMKPGDQHNFFISGSDRTTYAGEGTSGGSFAWLFTQHSGITSAPLTNTSAGHIARGSSGAVGAVLAQPSRLIGDIPFSGNSFGSNGVPFPMPSGAGVLYDRPILIDGANSPRALFPGVWFPMHNRPFADLSTVTPPAGLPTSAALLVRNFRGSGSTGSSHSGQVLFETGVEWA